METWGWPLSLSHRPEGEVGRHRYVKRGWSTYSASKGNLYLWEMPGPDTSSKFPSLLQDSMGSMETLIQHAGSSSSWRSLPFFIVINEFPEGPVLGKCSLEGRKIWNSFPTRTNFQTDFFYIYVK